jgi:hypothetical protein
VWEAKFLAEIMAGRDRRILPTTQPAAEHLTVEKWRALPAFVPVETKELRRDNGRQLRRSSLRQGVSEGEWRALPLDSHRHGALARDWGDDWEAGKWRALQDSNLRPPGS